MADELPQDRQVWLRAFYGFGPEGSGFLGFTHEGDRESVLSKLRDGDLVLIYGAVDEITDRDAKSQILGFLEVSRELCDANDRSAREQIAWKQQQGFSDRWNHGLIVRRAWRVRNRVHVRTVAPEAYDNKNRFERTKRAIILNQDERKRALSHPVVQCNVFGEPQIPEADLEKGQMGELLKPSRGIPPSFGTRTSEHKDGECWLYLMIFSGKADVLMGPKGNHKGKALAKVGRSNDTSRRLGEINSGFPKTAIYKWELSRHQKFPDAGIASRLEEELKSKFEIEFSSAGNEFFTGDENAMIRTFETFCSNQLPIILAAPGKAQGI